MIMALVVFALPVVPGKTNRVRGLGKEIETVREEYEQLNRRATLNAHRVFLQSTPAGDIAIYLLEADDFSRVPRIFGATTYDDWWLDWMRDVHGLSQDQIQLMASEHIFTWTRLDESEGQEVQGKATGEGAAPVIRRSVWLPIAETSFSVRHTVGAEATGPNNTALVTHASDVADHLSPSAIVHARSAVTRTRSWISSRSIPAPRDRPPAARSQRPSAAAAPARHATRSPRHRR